MTYRGYTIQEDFRNPYSKKPEYMLYPTEDGAFHDYDYDGDGYKYCGNCKWADSIEEAKDTIDEIVMMAITDYQVETTGPFPIGGVPQLNITKFTWLSDAVKFAVQFKGELNTKFLNP